VEVSRCVVLRHCHGDFIGGDRRLARWRTLISRIIIYFFSWGTSLTILFKPYKLESCIVINFISFTSSPSLPPFLTLTMRQNTHAHTQVLSQCYFAKKYSPHNGTYHTLLLTNRCIIQCGDESILHPLQKFSIRPMNTSHI
jgi:hypothetical protein